MTRTLVVAVKRPLAERDLARFGISAALARGYAVRVVDFSVAVHPMLDNRPGTVRRDGLEIIAADPRRPAAHAAALMAGSELVVMAVVSQGLSRVTMPAVRAASRAGVPYLMFAPALYPRFTGTGGGGLGRRLADIRKRFAGGSVVSSVLGRIDPRWLRLSPAAYMVNGSLAGQGIANNLRGSGTIPIAAHTWDYDQIMSSDLPSGPGPTPTAVFIDAYVPYHPDDIARGLEPVEPDPYFSQLNRLFERIERRHGLEVVIAAHPRADYDAHPEAFPGRRIVHGRTLEALARSSLVLSHASTALGMAVALGKPVGLLTDRRLYDRTPYHRSMFDGYADALGTPLRFCDDPDATPIDDILEHDQSRREAFVARYLRHPDAPERPLWDIIYDKVGL